MPLSTGSVSSQPPEDVPFKVQDVYVSRVSHFTDDPDLSIVKLDLSSADNTIIRANNSILLNQVDTNKLSIASDIIAHCNFSIDDNLTVDANLTC